MLWIWTNYKTQALDIRKELQSQGVSYLNTEIMGKKQILLLIAISHQF